MSEIPTSCKNGKKYNTNFYNLEAVIAVGFRTNSDKEIQFRQWLTTVLKDFFDKKLRGIALESVKVEITNQLF